MFERSLALMTNEPEIRTLLVELKKTRDEVKRG
jgi:hypothetical protein